MTGESQSQSLSRVQLLALSIGCGAVVANGYYIHPIISEVGAHFGVSDAMIGLVPALNQIALAVGIILLLPLGDWISNKRLTVVFNGLQFAAIGVMALAGQYWLFLLGSTILGFVTIVPYLLPAYVSKRVPPEQLGHATALLTTGIIGGILLARAGAGIVGEFLGWRTVYWIAAGVMLAVSAGLPLIMDTARRKDAPRQQQSYFGLIASLGPLLKRHPEIILTGAIQAMNFGLFLSIWMGLGLHLTSDEMGFGVDVVGYLALLALLNLFVTPRMGAWADQVGARLARFRIALIQLAGASLFFVTGHSLWWLMAPIMLTNVPGPVIDVTCRMTFLDQPPEVRTRLMTIYIAFMFLGGGLASWAGTAAYDWMGWTGNAALATALSAGVCGLSWLAMVRSARA